MRIGALQRRSQHGPEAGMTMIELLIAGVVMVVGFLGVIGLILTAIASNHRSKVDSTATMVAEAVLDQLNSTANNGTGTATLTDCSNTGHAINTAAGGSALTGPDIDFSQASPPSGYHMDYVVCMGNIQATYDVRWRLDPVTASGSTYLVTVGAHMKNTGSATTTNLRFFALPVTLRSFIQTPN